MPSVTLLQDWITTISCRKHFIAVHHYWSRYWQYKITESVQTSFFVDHSNYTGHNQYDAVQVLSHLHM